VLAVFGTAMWTLGALILGVGIWRFGYNTLKGFARPVPAPLPAGEMRKVDIRYRCTLCGMELRVRLADHEDPDPPRHCQEDMVVVAPLFE
jgi:hypothetical protein